MCGTSGASGRPANARRLALESSQQNFGEPEIVPNPSLTEGTAQENHSKREIVLSILVLVSIVGVSVCVRKRERERE